MKRRGEPMKNGLFLIISSLVMLSGLGITQRAAAAAPLMNRTYVWVSEFVAVDVNDKTVTARAHISAHASAYIDRFKPADRLMLVWDMIGEKTQADTVLYLSEYDVMKKSQVDLGYILPVEFVSADVAGKTVTFKAHVPDDALQTLKSARPGKWIKVTASMSQPSEVAVITTIELVDRLQSTTASK